MADPQKVRDEVEQQMEVLYRLRHDKQMDRATFGKMCVLLADVFVEEKMIDDAIELLRRVPEAYYVEDQPKQMEEANSYCEIAVRVAEAISQEQVPAQLFPMTRGMA